jgi:tRNA nucleotidyltransferase (CCA-adding enzyme)
VKTYLVGGAVRDRLLGLPVRERDWVVVGATEAEMRAAGFERLDAAFPVFRHPETGEEYALARTETKTGPGYKGFEVHTGPDVTLEQDLRRRDLTINALAEDGAGEVIDCFGGLEDLDLGLLRHVSPAFVEDPVRVLRAARFAARLGRFGFRVAHGTHALMKRMAVSEDFRALRPERVWRETLGALAEDQPWRYFEVLHRCGALAVLMPDLARRLGESGAHRGRGDPSPLAALKRATACSGDPGVRFAALMHDAAEADPRALCTALRAEAAFCGLLEAVVRQGPAFRACGRGDARAALAVLEALRAFQQPEPFGRFLVACRALWPDAGEEAAAGLEAARVAAAAVSGQALSGAGLSGPELGEALSRQRLDAIRAAWRARGGVERPGEEV